MEDSDSEKWKETIYWNHFNTFHFTLVLPSHFHDHLVLPEKFAQHMKSQLPDKVFLKGPSGAIWEVQLFKIDDLRFVGNEWKDFVKAHDLKESSRLMFKFFRSSTFEVLIFEQGSCCEKEAAYFIKKCRHLKSDHDDQRKTVNGDGTTKVIQDKGKEEEDDYTFVVAKRSKYRSPKRKGRLGKVQVPRKMPRKGSIMNEKREEPSQLLERDVITPVIENGVSLSKNYRSQRLETPSKTNVSKSNVSYNLRSSNVTRELRTSDNGDNSQAVNNSHQMENQSEKELSGNDTAKELTKSLGQVVIRPDYRESSPKEDHSLKTRGKQGRPTKQNLSKSSKKLVFSGEKLPKEYKSNRRLVTDKEKEDAFQRATKRETEHSFTSVLPSTSVYKKFYLHVPVKWLHDHLLPRNQEVVLRVGSEAWSTSLFYHGKRGSGILTGWKKFALDNNLEESDVLVFTLSSSKDATPILMDVEIFRVVPTTVPPLPVMP